MKIGPNSITSKPGLTAMTCGGPGRPLECILVSFLLDGRDYGRHVSRLEAGLKHAVTAEGKSRLLQYLEYLRRLKKNIPDCVSTGRG